MKLQLIYKYLSNQATEQEVQTLFDWIHASDANKKQFIALKKTWALTMLTEDIQSDLKPLQLIQPKKNHNYYFKYVALIIVLLGLAKFAITFNQKPKLSKEIVLELSDGSIEYITKNNQVSLLKKGDQLVAKKYANEIKYFGKVKDEDVLYHSIQIPNAKTFKLTLSDGTVVYLNSGSSLRYPAQFGLNGKRNVYLSGEAFFEVSKDVKRPFVVNTNEAAIEVLGTKFNVTAYNDQPAIGSVLVEGSIKMVDLSNKLNAVIIKPNQQVVWQKKSKLFSINVVDTSFYTAWTKGEMVLNDTPFSTISKILERSYDITIVDQSTNLSKQNFTGTISIHDLSIENILDILKCDTSFNYKRVNNTITITNQ